MQEMDPYDAKKLFETLQASVQVDLSGIEESEKTITTDGFTIKLDIVRPVGEEGVLPCLCSFMEVAGYWAISHP
jgi:hypothetical protein